MTSFVRLCASHGVLGLSSRYRSSWKQLLSFAFFTAGVLFIVLLFLKNILQIEIAPRRGGDPLPCTSHATEIPPMPTKAHRSPRKFNEADKSQKYEELLITEELYRRNLYDVDVVRKDNQDDLPTVSYFGTKGTVNFSSMCHGTDASRCVPKLQHSETIYRILPSRKLAMCAIQKNMSSILRAILCYLADPRKFVDAGRVLTREVYDARFCRDEDTFYNYEMNEFIPLHFNMTPVDFLAEWQVFAVIRDPFERFFSAYSDKCIRRPTGTEEKYCNGCRHNLTCFIIREYENQIATHGWNPLTVESSKFFPQNWECNFHEYLPHFELLMYNATDNDRNVEALAGILARHGVEPQHVAYLEQELRVGKTWHTTSMSPARQYLEERVRGSPYLMEFLVRMYYWDYVLFKWTPPVLRFPE